MVSRFEMYKAYHAAVKKAEEAQKLEAEAKNTKTAYVKGQKVVQSPKEKQFLEISHHGLRKLKIVKNLIQEKKYGYKP